MKKLTLLLIIALAFTACKKEVNNNVPVPGEKEFRILIQNTNGTFDSTYVQYR